MDKLEAFAADAAHVGTVDSLSAALAIGPDADELAAYELTADDWRAALALAIAILAGV